MIFDIHIEEVDEKLGRWTLKELKQKGIEFIMNSQVIGATPTSTKLDNGNIIDTYTLVWSTGVTPSKLIADLPYTVIFWISDINMTWNYSLLQTINSLINWHTVPKPYYI